MIYRIKNPLFCIFHVYCVPRSNKGKIYHGNTNFILRVLTHIYIHGNRKMASTEFTTVDALTKDEAKDVIGQELSLFNQSIVNKRGFGAYTTSESMNDIVRLQARLSSVVLGLTKPELSWINKITFPTRLTNELRWEFIVKRIEQGTLELLPEFGVPRILGSKRSLVRVTSQHFGKNAEMELSFSSTAEGAQTMANHITQFASMTTATMASLAMQTLYAGHNRTDNYGVHEPELSESEEHERIMNFAIDSFSAHKSYTGLTQTVLSMRTKMRERAEIVPDTAIVPFGKIGLMHLSNPLFMQHDKGGDKATEFLHGDGTVYRINDVDVREAPKFISVDGNTERFHERLVTGEYNIIPVNTPTIEIFDVPHDGYAKIHFRNAFVACELFTRAQPDAPAEGAPPGGAPAGDKWKINEQLIKNTLGEGRFKDKNEQPMEFFKWNKKKAEWVLRKIYSDSKTIEEWSQLIHIALFRLWPTYQTQPLVVVAGGKDLGFTPMSPGLIEVNYTASNFSVTIGYRTRLAVVLLDWDRTEVKHHVFYDGYLWGGGTKFITSKEAKELASNQYVLSGMNAPCMIAMAMPSTIEDENGVETAVDPKDFGSYMRMTRCRHGAKSQRRNGSDMWPSYDFYAELFGLNAGSLNMMTSSNTMAKVCYLGPSRILDSGQYVYTEGKGHHGPMVGAGCWGVRTKGCAVYPYAN